MVVPVAVLTVLSTIGGLLEIAGVWHPFGHWVAQVAEPLVEPTTAQDWGTSAVTVAVGLAGVWIAWAVYRTGRLSVPSLPGVQRLLEHKFYFDEVYDAIAYRPAQLLAARLHTEIESPFVEGSLEEIGRVGREAGAGVARVQSGLLRSYAIAIAVSALVLAVVFTAVR
jgi:NADH:ubiquinone oxidoreductase subunit 5 (subunit L)/multisubunit Na+/H+ antiporter MnhA subunit